MFLLLISESCQVWPRRTLLEPMVRFADWFSAHPASSKAQDMVSYDVTKSVDPVSSHSRFPSPLCMSAQAYIRCELCKTEVAGVEGYVSHKRKMHAPMPPAGW